ncbi:hypothetical protein KJ909_03965 [Patescibacteria group bacterium]|nr:hypothetical protein [Patescibacteria group bacterium]
MGTKVTWAKYGSWSGPQVRGTCPYVPPANPTGFDVIVAAVARPEGGAWDTVVMYDRTAVTYGLLQWTFTSGRLHKLLVATAKAMVTTAHSASYWYPFGDGLKKLTNLRVNVLDGNLYLGEKKVTDYFKLRDICTPPGGVCPKSGPNWEKAKAIALLFSKLGEDSIAQEVQLEFFREELKREIALKRPKLGGASIAEYLWPRGWSDNPDHVGDQAAIEAARALMIGMWQNSPRKAEELLDKAARGSFMPLSTQAHLERLAKKYAFTSFARWGVEKAKAGKYQSRYQKVATAINDAMGQKIVPEYWRSR